MSSRALRRLRQGSDLTAPELRGSSEEDEVSAPAPVKNKKKNKKKGPVNPFDLLNNEDDETISLKDEDGQGDAEAEDQQQDEALVEKPSPTQECVKKKKKKKKKKGAKTEAIDGNKNDDDKELDEAIREVNEMYGEQNDKQTSTDNVPYTTSVMRALLNVEHRYLNANNEMKRIFGSRVVQSEQVNRRRGGRNRPVHRSSWLAQHKDTWPPMGKTGLSMKLLETKNGVHYFTFEHSSTYQQVQFEFLDAVESLNPQNIVNVMNIHHYHIDTLIQLSEVCKMSEDVQMAAELIERAVYACEMASHPMFNFTQGNVRLDYRRSENRAFYIALFRHLVFVGLRGCYRTALELCKLIISLDPESDPLCILLMMDFYALRSEQYSFIVRMYDEWEAHRNLSQLPNFAFSVPLALYHLSKENTGLLDRANNMLQNSLIMFPGFLPRILDKCGVNPDKKVTSHPFYTSAVSYVDHSVGLQQLIALYVGRGFSCWKEPDVVQWLETNVNEVLLRVDRKDPLVKDYAKKRQIRYRGTPRNIYRHIVMSEIQDAKAALPPDMANAPIMNYDPLPPTDSIVSYTRPERPRRQIDDPNVLSMFLRSLLPNFNPDEVPEVNGDGPVGGAAGDDGNNLRQGIGALMDAMRDLLHNMQPVPPPVENRQNDDEEEQDWVDNEDGQW